ncbi:MAG: hypothetical protein AB2L14_01790 [Candidatus Xenobiia bacterium LiM19]
MQDNAELINDGGKGCLAHILNVIWGTKFCKASPRILTLSIPASLLNHGFEAVYWCAAGICLLGLIFTILTAREKGRSPADQPGRP